MRLGLIINPIAGVGGRLALKGSDGELAARALGSGAKRSAAARAIIAMEALHGADQSEILTSGGAMGADAVRAAGLRPHVVHDAGPQSTASDTIDAARAIAAAGAELIAFAGGDGTARDMLTALGSDLPVLGIPAGVKLHSSLFATSPRAAGAILCDALHRPLELSNAEVLDRPPSDASAPPILFGAMRVPAGGCMQAAKATRPAGNDVNLPAFLVRLARTLKQRPLVILGPGSTMFSLKQAMGIRGTLLGVDLLRAEASPVIDADETTILRHCNNQHATLVLGVVGGQGFLLGRGNQQVSPDVIRRVGRDNIIVVASAAKLAALSRMELLVDTGDAATDALLAGYMRVEVGLRQSMIVAVEAR